MINFADEVRSNVVNIALDDIVQSGRIYLEF